ncbi:MAG: glycosyl hydrolase family 8, partial [Roseococcus sp.]
TFELLLAWTREHLARPFDSLSAWLWAPNQPHRLRETNNATDGDLAIAWALQRGAARWGVEAWRQQAIAISRDILTYCLRDVDGRCILLPGVSGFGKAGHVMVNPSYYMFPAIRALATLLPDSRWSRLQADGEWLLANARFGRWGLPSDWVDMSRANGRLTPATDRPERFSWDAMRVPLFLVWGGLGAHPAVAAAADFWREAQPGRLPVWVDLRSGALAPYAGHAGVAAVAALARSVREERSFEMPLQTSAADYYSGALIMLARMAQQESAINTKA